MGDRDGGPSPVTRVVAGTLGGRRLDVPHGGTVRPTSDRVREALFSTLGGSVAGAAVLDLFAGSGALGIEALSRGASRVTFVERDRGVARVLRANLDALDLAGDVHVGAATRFVAELASRHPPPLFDLVFCDPPYGVPSDRLATLLTDLVRGGHVAADAIMVVERARQGDELTVPADVGDVGDVRTYGDTVLYYVRAAAGGDQEGGPDR